MSRDPATVSIWRTRVTWAALGAGVSAALLWNRAPPGPVTADEPAAMVPREPVVVPVEPPAVPPSTDRGGSTTTMPTSGTSPPEDATSTGSIEATTEDTGSTDGEALPQIPLPRMPGSRFMRRARQIDEPTGDPIIVLGLSVPAPGSQVEAFYRSAMKDARLKVFGGSGTAGLMREGYRSTLRGRGKHSSVEITINQRPGKLRSVVRIYWRIKP